MEPADLPGSYLWDPGMTEYAKFVWTECFQQAF